ncbi:hypothetical protein [Maricaulis sp. CAU 1757]
MRTINILAAVSSAALVAACSAGEASEPPRSVVAMEPVAETELQGGVVAAQRDGAREVHFLAFDDSGRFAVEPMFTVSMPTVPHDRNFRISFSPDAQASHVLVADCNKGGIPDMRIFDSRTGDMVTDMTEGFLDQVIERTDISIGDLDLVETWWTDQDDFVVQVAVTREDGTAIDDLLLRYNLSDHENGKRAAIAEFVRFPSGQLPTAAPRDFAPAPHEFDANYRLRAVDGRITLDGLPVAGGPVDVAHVTGVINVPLSAGA